MEWYRNRSSDPQDPSNVRRGLISSIVMVPVLVGVLVMINAIQSSMSSFWPNVFFGGFLLGDLILIRRAVLLLKGRASSAE